MKDNLLKPTEPGKDRSDSLSGFAVSDLAWLASPATPFEFFDITRPHLYVINGVPMAFVGEVSND